MSAGLKLQGQFKFDLYDKSGNLLQTSNYVDNFITQSGLRYPLYFAFADCFRFLSAGSGDIQNSILTNSETVGLETGIPELSYIGSRNDYNNPNSTNYAKFPYCGYRFSDKNIVELYRGWTLPNNSGGEDGVFKTSGILKEFMVSPGRPYVYTYQDEEKTQIDKKLCSCNESASETPLGSTVKGRDCSAIANYYNFIKNAPLASNYKLSICEATGAFARVVFNQPYVSGSVLNITYKLTISINTGIRFESMSDSSSPDQNNFYGNWNLVQGVTQPGIKLINDGLILNSIPPSAPNTLPRLQHFGYGVDNYIFNYEYGESFIPSHGIPLEPSIHYIQSNESPENSLYNIVYYLSEDNSQFLVSENGGAFKNTGEYAPWNLYSPNKIYYSGNYVYFEDLSFKYINENPDSGKSLEDEDYWENLGYLKVVTVFNSGIKKYKNDVIFGGSYWTENSNEFNIRFSGSQIPYTGNILENSISLKNIYKNSSRGVPIVDYFKNTSTRKMNLVNNFEFRNYSIPERYLYIKSVVSSYRDAPLAVKSQFSNIGDKINLVPFLDGIFESNKGQGFLPKVKTGILDFEITGAFISGTDNLDYFYLSENDLYPILFSNLTWTVDCPSSVLGCLQT